MWKLETERFLMRKLKPDDATPKYLSWLANQKTSKYIRYKQNNLVNLKNYICETISNSNVNFLAVIDKRTGEHIGNIKFIFLNPEYSVIEMGILIGESSYHGRGVAGELINEFARFAVRNYNSKLMLLGVDKSNLTAIKAYRKIGFKEEKKLYEIDRNIGLLMSWSLPELE